MHANLNRYTEFVEGVTSKESNSLVAFIERINYLEKTTGINMPLLMTGGFGLGSESGEFQEIVKKALFQGKELDEATVFHMKRELGDIVWYWVNACRALNMDPNQVIAENVTKLEARYPGGKFDVFMSENRKDGDL